MFNYADDLQVLVPFHVLCKHSRHRSLTYTLWGCSFSTIVELLCSLKLKSCSRELVKCIPSWLYYSGESECLRQLHECIPTENPSLRAYIMLPCASDQKQFLTHVYKRDKQQAVRRTLLHCMRTLGLSCCFSHPFYHTGWLDSTE